jgi:lipoprotein-releasing system ATP-binding protein
MGRATDQERTRARNHHIGFVFQFHFLLPEFTAAENIMLPMRKKGTSTSAEMKERARILLDLVGLEDKVDRLSNQLSGGEQQRLAIARSLANAPAVVLADEPTGNLDHENSQRVFDLLVHTARSTKMSILVVTHNRELAGDCDRVYEMHDGVFV